MSSHSNAPTNQSLRLVVANAAFRRLLPELVSLVGFALTDATHVRLVQQIQIVRIARLLTHQTLTPFPAA